ncbi:MAG: hypothetical protein KDJ27_19860 [Gammaproteobacteria bacterium]|nr:hypothetical protein [Gammaproteobacteria bacterium]MCB1925958.1 hypothetical protein [Gammaproteobacteria bacterium]
MLKNLGRLSLLLKLGRRVCVCMPNARLDGPIRERIRPWVLWRFACWCDRSS